MSVLMVPSSPPPPGSWHDRLRLALANCSFGLARGRQRFAADIAKMPLDKITPAQWAYALRLAYLMRRQMPDWLVPPKGLLPPPRPRPAAPAPGAIRNGRNGRNGRAAPPAPEPLLPLW